MCRLVAVRVKGLMRSRDEADSESMGLVGYQVVNAARLYNRKKIKRKRFL
jgi:hypothetical protein